MGLEGGAKLVHKGNGLLEQAPPVALMSRPAAHQTTMASALGLAMQTPAGWRAAASSPHGTTLGRPCSRIPSASFTSRRRR